MPYVHTYPLTIRHYECDAYGRVNPANILRYMQEAAFAGSAAVGYTPQRYANLNLQWLAYETDIEYKVPVHYNDELAVKTWVVDFRRVRSLRNYEFYRGEQHVVSASTDWVLLDTTQMRPTTIPDDIIESYSQGERVDPAPPRKPLPQMPKPKHTFTTRRRVVWSEIDPAMHVNNAVYLNYVVDAAEQHLGMYGWSRKRLMDNGYDLVTRRHQIEYKLAAVLGDEIEVSVWFDGMSDQSGMRYFTITRTEDNKLLCRVREQWHCVRRMTQEPVTIPDEFRSTFV